MSVQDKPEILLSVSDLNVSYHASRRAVHAVQGVDLEVRRGQMTAIVGESGSGKSTSALATMGLLPRQARVSAGHIRLAGEKGDLSEYRQHQWRRIRGVRIGLVPQDPSNSLNPLKTIGDSVGEGLAIHRRGTAAERHRRVLELLEQVGIDDPVLRSKQYPHELSGGMRQRVLIAAAVALKPDVLIADEPTSALDVTVQKTILDLIDRMRADLGLGVLLITHDLAVAGDRADHLVVMKNGQIIESGHAAQVLADPRHEYSRRLLSDAPSLSSATVTSRKPSQAAAEPILTVKDIECRFGSFTAVDGVSFSVPQGSTHAIVGESGSGKTTTGRMITAFQTPSAGTIEVAGMQPSSTRVFRQKVQLVYQNPYSSLDPRWPVGRSIAEPLHNTGKLSGSQITKKVEEFLDLVALDPGLASRRPAELSGGQCQRVAIARAMIVEPDLVVLDEAVSALDVTVQSQILRLLASLQEELGLTYVFISHDLAVVREISDAVTVMSRGKAVENGPTQEVFDNPREDYTRRLIAAIPGSRYRSGALNLGL